jgi:hypothetical protein
MKWYDYALCLSCADMISTGVVSGNFILVIFGVLTYVIWELIRKIDNGLL